LQKLWHKIAGKSQGHAARPTPVDGPTNAPRQPRRFFSGPITKAMILALLLSFILAGCDNQPPPVAPVANKIVVLGYHGIGDDPGNYTTTAARFESQVAALRARGYKPIGLNQLDAYLDGKAAIPAKSFLLTFDDALISDYDYVFPYLRKNHLQAVFFVPTGHIGAGGKLDAQRIRTMNDDDCCAFGSHSVSHKNLYTLSAADLAEELRASKETLVAITGEKVIAFAYPSGFFADRDITALRQGGYKLAFTVMPGLNDMPSSPYEIRRITVSKALSDASFTALVDGDGAYYQQYYTQMLAKSSKSKLHGIARLCAEELRRYEAGTTPR
jgi:peptidoglycan/xylan/chitin deacetylase (PgdA/CDA1 family)